jgi:hypothetical protein
MSAYEDLLEQKRVLVNEMIAIENDLVFAKNKGWKRDRNELVARKNALTLKIRAVKHQLALVAVRSEAEFRSDSYDPEDPVSLISALREEVCGLLRSGAIPKNEDTQQLLDDARLYVLAAKAAQVKREDILKRAKVVTR